MAQPAGSIEAAIIEAFSADTAESGVKLILVESFMMGMLCASIPLGSYMIWIKLRSASRVSFFVVSWITLVVLIVHWALSLQHFVSMIETRTLFPLIPNSPHSASALDDALNLNGSTYGPVWQFVLPLVTETALFGFSTVLFAILGRRPTGSQWNTLSGSPIPILALVMYTASLAHWAVSVRYYLRVKDAQTARNEHPSVSPAIIVVLTERQSLLALAALLSANVVLSDAIVLWRMCIAWNNKRPAIAFGALLITAILALNIGSIRALVMVPYGDLAYDVRQGYNHADLTQYAASLANPYHSNHIGLAAAFLSLASNFCATALVGVKAWLYRRQIGDHVRSTSRRTAAERLLELLVDSGTLYTAIWVLYCVSFFRPITNYTIELFLSIDVEVTAVDHLNAAMAQITARFFSLESTLSPKYKCSSENGGQAIYPLMIFIFMVLDKTHHSRGPRALRAGDWSEVDKDDDAEMVAFDTDVNAGRHATFEPHSAVTLSYDS
ncbi:hypothetical protein PENSPDRAFT_754282 [Peniophora sp. CONT]|nr:hypothetical protein PENSPDRAFT_754282 [Peniophora sp. CONT]